MLPLTDTLPDSVLDELAAQLRNGIAEAVERFPELQGDEDSVTGGLIQAIGRVAKGTDPDSGYSWKAVTWKLRGRGKGAPEKRIGADAMLEIQVSDDDGALVTRKSLPIQSKKTWADRDRLLAGQAQKIAQIPGGGIVVDYTERGYFASSALFAARADGDRRRMPPDTIRPLGDVLADEFIPCRIGSTNVFFDAASEVLMTVENGTLFSVPFRAKHRVRINVAPTRRRRTRRK